MTELASEGLELQRFGFDFDFDFGFDILLGLAWWLKLTSFRCSCRELEREREDTRGRRNVREMRVVQSGFCLGGPDSARWVLKKEKFDNFLENMVER